MNSLGDKPIQLKAAILLAMLTFSAGQSWAETYYVWKNGQIGQAACTTRIVCYSTTGWSDAFPSGVDDLEAVVELGTVETGDTILISGGNATGAGITYYGTEIDADSILGIDKQVSYIGGVRPNDPGYSQHGGRFILDNGDSGFINNGIIRPQVHCALPGACVIGRLKFQNGDANSYGILTSASNWLFEDIEGTDVGRGIGVVDGTGSVFRRIRIYSTSSFPLYSTVPFRLEYFLFHTCPAAIWFNGGNPTLNNGTIVGFNKEALFAGSTSSPVLNNLLITATAITDVSKYLINNAGSGTVLCNNCIVVPNPADFNKVSIGSIVFNEHVTGSPLFVKGRRPGIIVFGVDDYGSLGYFRDIVAPRLEAKGWRGTYALSRSSSITPQQWSDLSALTNAGHDVAVHGDSYSNLMTDRRGFQIAYSGMAVAADCRVTDSGGDYATHFRCINDTVTVIDLDLNQIVYNTIDEVVSGINVRSAIHGYTATKRNADSGNATASKYLATQSQNVKAGLKNFDLSDDRVFNGELRDVKAWIDAGIPGYTCSYFVPPGNASDPNMIDALASLGFMGARGSGSTGQQLMASLNIYNLAPRSLYKLFGNDADPQNTIGKLEEYLGSRMEYCTFEGAISFFYAHATSEFSAEAWDALLDYVAKHDVRVMSLGEAIAYIKANGTTVDNRTYTRSVWPSQSDYRLRPFSPAINEGTEIAGVHDLPNLTDLCGNVLTDESGVWLSAKYGVNPSIGACEYDPEFVDSDWDGLSDDQEIATGTNHLDADTDDDGIPDGVEDANRDGYSDFPETDPRNLDSDGDGIQDGTEKGFTLANTLPDTDTDTFISDADPSLVTNPLNMDSDGDQLLDGQEDANRDGRRGANETDPTNPDTDGDGYSDGEEVGWGTNPLDANSRPFETPAVGSAGLALGFLALTALGFRRNKRA